LGREQSAGESRIERSRDIALREVEEPAAESPEHIAPRWLGGLFALTAVALVPWIIYLSFVLPRRTIDHPRTAWVGFDIVLVTALAITAILALRRSNLVAMPAVATATLLLVDAWFDVTTSGGIWPRYEAVLLGIFVELPLAALCIYVARRVETRAGALRPAGIARRRGRE
jgi:hypothetical protein